MTSTEPDRTPGDHRDDVLADDEQLLLPGTLDPDTVYDVMVNGQHVWPLQPGRDTIPDADGRLVATWPKALRRHLSGRAWIRVRSHVDRELVGATRHVFGGKTKRRANVVDAHGNPLVLDKYDRLTRPLSAEGAADLEAFLDDVEQLLTDLREHAGVPAFISYGTLLGAVRDGRLIGHDNDVDLAYVSEHAHPVDVVREGYRVERALADRGWSVRRGAGTRLNVRLPQSDGTMRFVDIFTAHWVEGWLYMPSDTGFRLPRETVLPLTTVSLHGRAMPAPADSEVLLAETYGPQWRTPDPSFKYETPTWLTRRLAGWFGGLRVDRKVWDTFYAGSWERIPAGPTPFARWVSEHHPTTRPLLDLGTGTGRDATWFAEQGRDVVAVDYSLGILTRGSNRWPHPRVRREALNLNDLRHVLTLGVRVGAGPEPPDVYGRFLWHALDEHGRDHVLRLASMVLRRGGLLFLEFRTEQDRGAEHTFRNGHRRFVDPGGVVAAITARGGTVVERVEGHGLARFEDEDPHVCRLVASWSQDPAASAEPL